MPFAISLPVTREPSMLNIGRAARPVPTTMMSSGARGAPGALGSAHTPYALVVAIERRRRSRWRGRGALRVRVSMRESRKRNRGNGSCSNRLEFHELVSFRLTRPGEVSMPIFKRKVFTYKRFAQSAAFYDFVRKYGSTGPCALIIGFRSDPWRYRRSCAPSPR